MHALAPQKYTTKNREDARSWLDSFELYTQSEQIFDDRSKAINFLSRLETEVNKVVWTHASMNGDNQPTYKKLRKSFLALYDKIDKSFTHYLAEFHTRNQGKSESVTKYYTELMMLAKQAFPDINTETRMCVVGNKFIEGVNSRALQIELKKHMVEKDQRWCNVKAKFNPRYETLLTKAEQIASLYIDHRENLTRSKEDQYGNSSSNDTDSEYDVRRVNYDSRLAKVRCFSCQEYGHYSRDCPLNEVKHDKRRMNVDTKGLIVTEVARKIDIDAEAKQLRVEAEKTIGSWKQIQGVCRIDYQPTRFIVDTGTSKTIIAERVLTPASIKQIEPIAYNVVTANGEPFQIVGQKQCLIHHGKTATLINALIAKNLTDDCLLGMDFLMKSSATRKAIQTIHQELTTQFDDIHISQVDEELFDKTTNQCRLNVISKSQQEKSGRPMPTELIKINKNDIRHSHRLSRETQQEADDRHHEDDSGMHEYRRN